MLVASITFSSFDRDEASGGVENGTELLTDGDSVTFREESIFGDGDDNDGSELGFPNINKDVGHLEGGAVIVGIGG